MNKPMADYPCLPIWTDAYLADTRHLTTEQHGAYLLMLFTAWRDGECRLTYDENFLAKITGLNMRAWRRNKSTLLSFWHEKDGYLYQKRLLREREKVTSRKQQSRMAAHARWLKEKNIGNADAWSEHRHSDASISISISKPKNKNYESQESKETNDRRRYYLKSDTYERAREIAPGYDIYHLENRWLEWNERNEEILRNPDRAFLGFVKKHAKENPL